MLTWLDFYLAGARDTVPEAGNDLDAMRQMCLGTLSHSSQGNRDDPTRIALFAAILPFCLEHPEASPYAPPHGARFSSQLVADLA